MNVVGYADDLLLLAPTRDATKQTLNICERFTNENNIQFSTNPYSRKSKSKVLQVVNIDILEQCISQYTKHLHLPQDVNCEIKRFGIVK